MISGETKACFAKACDIFVQELTWRAWQLVRKHGRNTLQVRRRTARRAVAVAGLDKLTLWSLIRQLNDVSGAVSSDEMYDFLIDIAPQPVVKVAMVRRGRHGLVFHHNVTPRLARNRLHRRSARRSRCSACGSYNSWRRSGWSGRW